MGYFWFKKQMNVSECAFRVLSSGTSVMLLCAGLGF